MTLMERKARLKNGITHRFGRSLMIPEPHQWISSTYIPPRNASTARPEEHRVVRAATLPRAAVFEWKKRRKIRFFAEKPASRRAQSRASTTKRAVFARARTLRWWRVARPNSSRGKPGNGDGMMYFSLDAVGMDKTPSKRFVRHQPTLIPRRVCRRLFWNVRQNTKTEWKGYTSMEGRPCKADCE